MGGEEDGLGVWPPVPSGSPLYVQRGDHWTHFDNSVNAVSFGFVATAILISMFLVMAIFEKFLRTTSPAVSPSSGRPRLSDIEAQGHVAGFNAKLSFPSPKGIMYVDMPLQSNSLGDSSRNRFDEGFCVDLGIDWIDFTMSAHQSLTKEYAVDLHVLPFLSLPASVNLSLSTSSF